MIREITQNDFEGLLTLYMQLHENSMPDQTTEIMNLWNKIVNLIALNIIYFIYLLFIKNKLSTIFDSRDFIDKTEYVRIMTKYNEKNFNYQQLDCMEKLLRNIQ